MVDNEVEKLKLQQMVAKTRARTKIFEESEVDITSFSMMINKSLLDLLKIIRELALELAIKKSESIMIKPRNVTNNLQSKCQDVTEILCKLVNNSQSQMWI